MHVAAKTDTYFLVHFCWLLGVDFSPNSDHGLDANTQVASINDTSCWNFQRIKKNHVLFHAESLHLKMRFTLTFVLQVCTLLFCLFQIHFICWLDGRSYNISSYDGCPAEQVNSHPLLSNPITASWKVPIVLWTSATWRDLADSQRLWLMNTLLDACYFWHDSLHELL